MYAARRQAFMEKIQGAVAIFRSAPEFQRGRGENVEYPYRQDSDFYYLTGFAEPESICVLAPDHPEHKFILFVRPRDKAQETWTGRRAGTEGAINTYGADIAYTLDQLDEKLPQYLGKNSTLYYSSGQADAFDDGLVQFLRHYRELSGFAPTHLIYPGDLLDQMRLVKQPEELELMRKAGKISAQGHLEALKATRPGMYEYEVQAVVEYAFRSNGAMRNAYASIVGSGPNATILHYDTNNRRMEDGDLLLIDAGAEYEYYSGDITRTFPVNGHFTPHQRAIYELVLRAEEAAIASVKPGITLTDVHDIAVEIITSGLVELGLLEGDEKKLIEEKTYRSMFMHGTCHWLGIDVHDRGKYKRDGEEPVLQPGMVFTVEPGIYISADLENVDPKYHNIGVRIEDNVVVTEDGCEILTADVPKTIEEIEALMASTDA
jgi:Xaa-Pro aminopeptidase